MDLELADLSMLGSTHLEACLSQLHRMGHLVEVNHHQPPCGRQLAHAGGGDAVDVAAHLLRDGDGTAEEGRPNCTGGVWQRSPGGQM